MENKKDPKEVYEKYADSMEVEYNFVLPPNSEDASDISFIGTIVGDGEGLYDDTGDWVTIAWTFSSSEMEEVGADLDKLRWDYEHCSYIVHNGEMILEK